MTDIREMAKKYFEMPEVQEEIIRGMDEKFKSFFPHFLGEPTKEMYEEHRAKMFAASNDPWVFITMYAPKAEERMNEELAKEREREFHDSLFEGLEEHGFSKEEIEALKSRHGY